MEQKFLSDETKLLGIFPEEIWSIIFKAIDDPTDLLSTANASPVLEQYLAPLRNCYLLPQVLQILTKKQYLDRADSKAVLRCRMVCTRWRRVINKLLEIRPYHFKLNKPFQARSAEEDRRTARSHPNFYDDEEYVGRFDDIARGTQVYLYAFPFGQLQNEVLPSLSATHYQTQNPLPSRQLRLWENDFYEPRNEQEMTAYRNCMLQILEKVGHHVWHVEIFVKCENVREWYPLLRKYVQLMPNIKTLEIGGKPLSRHELRNQEAERIMAEMPFPRLNHCEHIEANLMPGAIISHILTVNDHVQNVEIYRMHTDGFHANQVGFPRNLCLHVAHADEIRMLPASAPLHYLRVETNEFFPARLKLAELFDKLECYSETLVKLYLELPRICPEERDSSAEILEMPTKPFNLPKLKRLRIRLDYLLSLDFLLGLKSLEYMSLCLFLPDGVVGQENRHLGQGRINFYSGYENRFMECNIWQLIPSLQKVELEYMWGRERTYRDRQTYSRLGQS